MNNIDLNIDNYSFVDILNLFNIDKNFNDKDLKRCKEVVEKIHPSKSALNISYYELFNNAYNFLESKNSLIVDENKSVKPYIFYNTKFGHFYQKKQIQIWYF